MSFEWGAVCRPKQGQQVSGDIYIVREHDESRLTVAVIDGLGGGEEAAKAARGAEAVMASNPGMPLQEMIQRSHTALRSTRGAVIGVLRLDSAGCRASYIGVGNIGVHVYTRQQIKPISKNGILGFRLPTLLELNYVYDPGDIFVLYSDGVSGRFSQDSAIDIRQPAQPISDAVMAHYGKQIDDATVVTIRT